MSGNLWECCHDCYSDSYYSSSPETDPTGPERGTYRVLRGGSWLSSAIGCRVAYRSSYTVTGRRDNYGMRLALTVE